MLQWDQLWRLKELQLILLVLMQWELQWAWKAWAMVKWVKPWVVLCKKEWQEQWAVLWLELWLVVQAVQEIWGLWVIWAVCLEAQEAQVIWEVCLEVRVV